MINHTPSFDCGKFDSLIKSTFDRGWDSLYNLHMNNRGGKRQGAGRKRGIASIKAEEARKYLTMRVTEELEPILTGQIELAKGAYHEVIDVEGKKIIYRKLPDSGAATYLLNQTIGRAKETVDMNVAPAFSLIALSKRAAELRLEDEGKLLEASGTPSENTDNGDSVRNRL